MGSVTDGPYADLDITTLTQQQASDYRQELYNVIFNQPEIELEVLAQRSGPDLDFYKMKMQQVDDYLATFTERILVWEKDFTVCAQDHLYS